MSRSTNDGNIKTNTPGGLRIGKGYISNLTCKYLFNSVQASTWFMNVYDTSIPMMSDAYETSIPMMLDGFSSRFMELRVRPSEKVFPVDY